MAVNWADLAGLTVLVAAGFAITYAFLRRTLRAAGAERQKAMESQLNALAATIRVLEARVDELGQIPQVQAAAASEFAMTEAAKIAPEPLSPVREQAFETTDEEVTPEMMVVIAAAVTAFLGKKVRILSARELQSPRQRTSPWSQQGRVFVQASHNLWSRG